MICMHDCLPLCFMPTTPPLLCRYYHSKMRKSPHVVGHYAAGARLIGLTEKQMEKHMATLSVTGDKDNDSPYAQPLRMFTTNIPTNILGKRKPHGKIRLIIKKKNGEVEEEEGPCNYKEGESNNSAHPMPNVSSALAWLHDCTIVHYSILSGLAVSHYMMLKCAVHTIIRNTFMGILDDLLVGVLKSLVLSIILREQALF